MNARQSLILDLAREWRDAASAAAREDTPRTDHELEVATRDLLHLIDQEFPEEGRKDTGRGAVPERNEATAGRAQRRIPTSREEDRPPDHGSRLPSERRHPARLPQAQPGDAGAGLSIREGILALLADGRWWTTPELVDAIERGGQVRAKVNSMTVGTALAEASRRGLVQRQPLEVARGGARFEWRAA